MRHHECYNVLAIQNDRLTPDSVGLLTLEKGSWKVYQVSVQIVSMPWDHSLIWMDMDWQLQLVIPRARRQTTTEVKCCRKWPLQKYRGKNEKDVEMKQLLNIAGHGICLSYTNFAVDHSISNFTIIFRTLGRYCMALLLHHHNTGARGNQQRL